ncbi:origin recognition complex subunit 2 [Fistulifera solaris]|uniref:Origin recognition complex subunit 2 n=1 Tax=Fistulifera solaris TaxID=1519565 RepID=A0A1Z5J9D9_FISSO|nr:origin recognition complex subunit 2 [Fistulifera solaris]|eukprot:GAX10610.1 origin recognition complex subunit 2 [Fistulifera solaris]
MSDRILDHDDSAKEETEEEEALEDLFLRHKFQHYAFPWNILNEAGWIYHSDSGYKAPTGRSFKTGKDVVDFLDYHAIPDVYSNLQSIEKPEFEATEEQIQLRRDLIQIMYRKTKRKSKGRKDQGSDTHSISSVSRVSASIDDARATSRRSTRNPVSERSTVESPVAEQSAELYMTKNSKRGKKPVSYSALKSDEPIHFPSLEKCRQISREHQGLELDAIQSELERDFDEWRFLLTTNHNLLFFGAGSKEKLLHSFGEKSLSEEGYVLLIDGFAKDVSVTSILDLFVKIFLNGEEPEPSSAVPRDDGETFIADISNPWQAHPLVERAINISRAIAYCAMETLEPIFLIIHNIEGKGLRTDVSQEALAALSVNSRVANGTASIRIVASIDDVDCSYKLWRLPVMASFSWIWKEVHTYRPYDNEFVMLESAEQQQRAKGKAAKTAQAQIAETKKARILSIIGSMAPKHAEILQILAQLQLQQLQVDQDKEGWVEFSTFRDQCKKKYIITKDHQLDPFLTELGDHRLIQKNIIKGVNYISIPHAQEELKKVVAYDVKSWKM